MSRIKILGPALAASCALIAIGATGATALPSYFHCVKLPGTKPVTGKYTTLKNCESLKEVTQHEREEIEEKGESIPWEFQEVGATESYKQDGSGSSGTLETVKKEKIQCTASKSTSNTNGPHANSEVVVTFEKCTGPVGSHCQSAGSPAETITTKPLKGTLGYIKKASPKEVGVLLEPETAGALDDEFTCTGFLGFSATLKVRGSLICKVGPLNEMTTVEGKGKIECLQSVGKQAVAKFEGEATNHTLETESTGSISFPYEQSGETNTQTLTTVGEELRA